MCCYSNGFDFKICLLARKVPEAFEKRSAGLVPPEKSLFWEGVRAHFPNSGR